MNLFAGVWPLAAAIVAATPSEDPDRALAQGWTWAVVAPRPPGWLEAVRAGFSTAALPRKGMVTVTSAAPLAAGDLLVGGVLQGPVRLGSTSVRDGATKVGFVARIDGAGGVRAVHLLDRRESRVERAEEPAVTALAVRADGGFVGSSRAHPLFERTSAGKIRWSNDDLPRAFSLALAENDDVLAAGCERQSGRSMVAGALDEDTSGYVARVSPAGKLLWRVDLVGHGDARNAVSCGTSIATAPGGDVLIGGTFEDELTIGVHVLRAASRNGFVARLSGAGVARWAKVLDSTGDIQIAVLPDGRVVMNSDVGGSEGSGRTGIAALDTTGRRSWFLPAMTSPPSTPRVPLAGSLVASAGGDLFWVGRFEQSIKIADAQLSRAPHAEDGVFVAKVDGEGQLRFLRRLPEIAEPVTRAWPVVVAATARWIWLAGELRGTSRGAFAQRIRR